MEPPNKRRDYRSKPNSQESNLWVLLQSLREQRKLKRTQIAVPIATIAVLIATIAVPIAAVKAVMMTKPALRRLFFLPRRRPLVLRRTLILPRKQAQVLIQAIVKATLVMTAPIVKMKRPAPRRPAPRRPLVLARRPLVLPRRSPKAHPRRQTLILIATAPTAVMIAALMTMKRKAHPGRRASALLSLSSRKYLLRKVLLRQALVLIQLTATAVMMKRPAPRRLDLREARSA